MARVWAYMRLTVGICVITLLRCREGQFGPNWANI